MEVGIRNKVPHYSVHGDKTKMYLYINESEHHSASEWITGRVAFQLWNELQRMFKKDKKGFIALLKKHHAKNPKLPTLGSK